MPHFEKMLYDNAQLALAYLHAWQVTQAPRHAEVVRDTLAFLARELLVMDDDGLVGLAASLDADTDGDEGRTYVWTVGRGERGARRPMRRCSPPRTGSPSKATGRAGRSSPESRDDEALAGMWSMSRDEVAGRLAASRARLLTVRDARPQPASDDKVIASWNGLALTAFAEAGRVLPDGADHARLATQLAASLQRRLRTTEGRLHRSWKDGRPGPAAVLEDHTHLAAGLLALYQTTFDERWVGWATELMDVVLRHFADPDGGFHDTADDADGLFARPRSLVDSPLPIR